MCSEDGCAGRHAPDRPVDGVLPIDTMGSYPVLHAIHVRCPTIFTCEGCQYEQCNRGINKILIPHAEKSTKYISNQKLTNNNGQLIAILEL